MNEKFKLERQAQDAWEKWQQSFDSSPGREEEKSKLALKAVAQAFDRNEVYKKHFKTTKANLKGIVYRALPYVYFAEKKSMDEKEVRKKTRAIVTDYLSNHTEYGKRYIIETMSRDFREIDLAENPQKVLSKKPSSRENTAAVNFLQGFRKKNQDMTLDDMSKIFRAVATLAAKTEQEEAAWG